MPFFSQSEAKQFLVELIAREAQVAGEALSEVERRLLLFSADEPASGQGIPEERLFQDDSDFEARSSELLKSAYKSADADERRKIAEAIREVNKGDHYVAVIAQPVANRTTRVRDIGLYVVIGLGVVALVIGYAIYVTG
jgi:negative regulator of replication initiation